MICSEARAIQPPITALGLSSPDFIASVSQVPLTFAKDLNAEDTVHYLPLRPLLSVPLSSCLPGIVSLGRNAVMP